MKLMFLLVASSVLVMAQESMRLNQPNGRELRAGVDQWYEVQLNAGDLAAGSVEQHGTVELAIWRPDGAVLKRFPGPSTDGNWPFAFLAETAGPYRLEVANPGTNTVNYELRLDEIRPWNEQLKTAPQPEKSTSGKIAALRKRIASGDKSTESFWNEIAREGTPLVEPIEKDPGHQLVTFLWRGADTRNVIVFASFRVGAGALLDNVMHRIPDSDVWYLTVKLPAGARFSYVLSPNDPLVFEGPMPAQRLASMQADPLNSHRWACPPQASRFDCQSMVELPGAVPQPWIAKHAETPAGMLQKTRIRSEILKNERNLSVYTPAGYKADGDSYGLLVVFDEQEYLELVPTPVILDNLIAASKIPALVAVLIANPNSESRSKELAPNPDFADFLTKELLPWVHARYNVTIDPRLTVIAGASRGGLAAMYAGLRHPELFGNILCQSGSLWWAPDHAADSDTTTETNWMAKEFIRSPKLPLKFYMDAGTFEYDTWGGGGGGLEPARHLRDVLLAKGYEVHYQQFVGGHDFLSWRGTFADGLLALIER